MLCGVGRSQRTRQAPCRIPRWLWGRDALLSPSLGPRLSSHLQSGRPPFLRMLDSNISHSLLPGAPFPPPTAVPVVPLVLGLAGDPPQGSEKAGAGVQGSEAEGPLTGTPPG